MIEQTLKVLFDNATANKVYLNVALEVKNQPYAVLSRVSGVRSYTHDGDDNYTVSRFQLSVFGKDYKTTKEYASNFYSISGYSGSNIPLITLDNETDLYDSELRVHQVVLDFIVRHYD